MKHYLTSSSNISDLVTKNTVSDDYLYPFHIINKFIVKDILHVKVRLQGTDLFINIPVQKLATNEYLISNIHPMELIQLGYEAREEEEKKKKKFFETLN